VPRQHKLAAKISTEKISVQTVCKTSFLAKSRLLNLDAAIELLRTSISKFLKTSLKITVNKPVFSAFTAYTAIKSIVILLIF
jgi:hypothetical protein